MDYVDQIEANLRRIKLASNVIAEVHHQLVDPLFPDSKADLLLATEELCLTAIELIEDVRFLVWGENTNPDRDS